MKRVTIADVENAVGFEIHHSIRAKILKENLAYEALHGKELENYILNYVKVLNFDITAAGEHRIDDWEKGWKENLQSFTVDQNLDALIPRYHTKSNIARLNNAIIKTFDPQFDFKLHSFMVDAILFKYIPFYTRICEFGCGTGYHLFRWRDLFPLRSYVGLDWSKVSQEIIQAVSKILGANVEGKNFDYFKPDTSFNVQGYLVCTVASLEQIGDNHGAFINYLIEQKAGICIHFEPIEEVLDSDNLLDYLTTLYFRKRNYLKGFLISLRQREADGKIKILEIRRLNYGSKFVEGHTLIIWKPL